MLIVEVVLVMSSDFLVLLGCLDFRGVCVALLAMLLIVELFHFVQLRILVVVAVLRIRSLPMDLLRLMPLILHSMSHLP